MVYILVIRFSNSKWLNSKDTGSNMAPFTFFFVHYYPHAFLAVLHKGTELFLFTRLHLISEFRTKNMIRGTVSLPKACLIFL